MSFSSQCKTEIIESAQFDNCCLSSHLYGFLCFFSRVSASEMSINSENIEILWETQTLGLFGEEGVEGAHLVRGKGTDHEEKFDIAIDGFFLAIGHHPNTDAFRQQVDEKGQVVKRGVVCDEQGYIVVQQPTTATNIPGVFAAGDVADPIYRQAISAAGSGCHAAMDAKKYLE